MSLFWLVLEGPPTRQFLVNSDARPYADVQYSMHLTLKDPGTIRSSVSGETVNVDMVLDNRGGAMSRLYGLKPPLGSMGSIKQYDGQEVTEIFRGQVYSASFQGEDFKLSLQI